MGFALTEAIASFAPMMSWGGQLVEPGNFANEYKGQLKALPGKISKDSAGVRKQAWGEGAEPRLVLSNSGRGVEV